MIKPVVHSVVKDVISPIFRCGGGASPSGLDLLFDNIANADIMISGNSSLVADWNTFFNLPTNGTPFTSVTVAGNKISLFNGSGITLRNYLFGNNDPSGTSLLEVVDNAGCVVACGKGVFSDYNIGDGCYELTKVHLSACVTLGDEVFNDCEKLSDLDLSFASYTILGVNVFNDVILLSQNYFTNLVTAGNYCFMWCTGLITPDFSSLISAGVSCFERCTGLTTPDFSSLELAGDDCFWGCTGLTTPDFSSLISAGDSCFERCTGLINLDLSSCTSLGTTTGNDDVFRFIIGNIITLTVPVALMICNGGAPDGDIAYLQANNTVTVIQV